MAATGFALRSSSILAEDRPEDALGSSAPEASVSAQCGSTYSGANHTQDGNIFQVGNINAGHVHIGREAQFVNVLEWLYASSYDSKHKKTRRERVQGSGTWLFERQEYQDWHCPTGPHRSLWCHGGPGAGKTCITSAIVDELLSTYEAREIGLAYIYLDYADKEAQTLENVLASILKQIALCKKKEGIEEVRRLWCACKIDNRSAEAEALVETLGRMCQHFRQIFVVLDALDECSDELRKLLLKHLQALDDPKWRFFLTGRSHLSNVLPKFLSCLQVTVSAHDNDIEKAVLARIQEEADLSELFDNNPSLEEKVVSKITEMAKGMFLLVTLMLNSIASSTCESDVEESLEHMPVDLDQSYERTLKRIEDQDSKKVELSYRILWWLSRARRPLSCDELRQAIAVRDGDRGRNTKKESKKGIMIKACMGLVFIDDTGGFRLVHFSTQEYLRTHFSELTMKQKLREDHIIARACLTILSYDEFEGGPCETSEAAQKRYEKHPMLSYAADYWHEHLSGSMSGRLSGPAMNFLRSSAKVRVATQFRGSYPSYLKSRYRKPRWFSWSFKEKVPQYSLTTGLHMAAELGVFYCVQQLLEEPDVDVNGTDDGCRTPLALAIRHDRAKVVELLLSAETIDCEHKANTGRTPLLDAVQYNHTDIVKQLLAKGVEVQVLDKEQMNGLHIAANTYYRSAQIVELLVGSGIDVNARNKKNQTPLHVTAGRGNCKAVEVLLSGGADVCAADKDGWTPLHGAATKDLATAQALHKAGADIHARSNSGSTVLYQAADSGQRETVEWLLSLGAGVSAANKDGWTPLHGAATKDLKTAKVMHEAGADIHARSKSGCTVICRAAANGQRETVEWLLSLGADASIAHKDGWTPLHSAATKDLATTQALYKAGADIHARSNSGSTVLYLAAANGQCETVEWLLAEDMLSPCEDGVALCAAAAVGSSRIVKLLLSQGVDVNAKDELFGHALHAACQAGHKDVAQLLLDHGATTHQQGGRYGLPLSAAAFKGHLDILHLLVEQDARCAKLVDGLGRNALHFAARGGHVEAFEFLLSKSVELSRADVKGNTVLHYAASGGSLSIVERLLDLGVVAPPESPGLWSPLHWAYRAADHEVVNLLKSYYSDGNVVKTMQPRGLWTPLSIGLYHRNSSQLGMQGMSEGTQRLADRHGYSVCDECYFEIYGLRFHCVSCVDFDVCFMCKPTVAKSHPPHGWKVFEYKKGVSIEMGEDGVQPLLSSEEHYSV